MSSNKDALVILNRKIAILKHGIAILRHNITIPCFRMKNAPVSDDFYKLTEKKYLPMRGQKISGKKWLTCMAQAKNRRG